MCGALVAPYALVVVTGESRLSSGCNLVQLIADRVVDPPSHVLGLDALRLQGKRAGACTLDLGRN